MSNTSKRRGPYEGAVLEVEVVDMQGDFALVTNGKELGNVLKALRLDANLTQAETAKIMGSSVRTVQETERGIRSPTLKIVFAYLAAVNSDLPIVLRAPKKVAKPNGTEGP